MPGRRRMILLIAIFMLLPAFDALCEGAATIKGVRVKDVLIQIGDNAVSYPQLEGMADEAVQRRVNDDIVTSGQVTAHILTLSSLAKSAWGLRVDYESYLDEYVFSAVIHAKGKQPNGRNGQSNTALCYDLRTGERVALNRLFQDEVQAIGAMEKLAQESLAGEMSAYMENRDILPLPTDSFMLDGDGITFYYPASQLSYLSGYAGACQFRYDELAELLLTEPDGLPTLMGLKPVQLSAAEAEGEIRQWAERGELPHVPASLGQGMAELAEQYRLVRTPDEFPGGRYFVMEAPQFRDILLISDAMQAGYDRSVLEGIQMKRGGLCGLMVGQARREEWRAILGAPEETIVFTEGMAYDYGLPMGESDIYRFGGHELRLHADGQGTLRCIQLGK